MKDPLIKRLPRELRKDLGKYLVIFLLLTFSIGFVSGYLVAETSMMAAYQESFTKYHIEDGHFTTVARLNKTAIKNIEAYGVTIYDLSYVEQPLTNGSTMRIFPPRTEVDLPCVMEGRLPDAAGEIAIDRMYADNNGLAIGDTLTAGAGGASSKEAARTWTITGLVALSDYSALFGDNNDSMFDALKFGVGLVSGDDFAAFSRNDVVTNYAWLNQPTENEDLSLSLTKEVRALTEKASIDYTAEEKQLIQQFSDDFLTALCKETKLESYVPRHLSQAITFTGADLGNDRGMMEILLYVIIAIIAFVFAVTSSNTIAEESAVIGTLRASGYTKRELLKHYMTMPVIVTLFSALVGNILGYTYFKYVCVAMYYGSYSLPTYTTIWSGEAFILTTVIPVAMMFVITYVLLRRKLSLSPLRFLRGELTRSRRSRALYLSPKLPFMTRFSLRVLLQNTGSYLVIFIGILFANLLLLFGMGLPAVLDNYQEQVETNLLADNQVLLQIPLSALNEDRKLESVVNMALFESGVETSEPTAEKFSVFSLESTPKGGRADSVLVYGIEPDSRYIHETFDSDSVVISSSFADKYQIGAGDEITLTEPYDDGVYTMTVTGIYDYVGGITVFMNRTAANRFFDEEDDYFCGYFSENPITDIDASYIGSTITLEDLTKISRQLDISMGEMMGMVNIFAVVIFLILLYLLTKLIIEKNAVPISLTKILGYRDGEINKLYLLPTTFAVLVSLIVTLPIEKVALSVLFRLLMVRRMSGWIPLDIDFSIYVKMFLIGSAAYFAVAALETRRIKKVRMDEALKMRE